MSKNVIVVGAGVVGLTMSLGLSQLGFEVSLVDANDISPSPMEPDYDLRVYAINQASSDLFKRLSVWDAMVRARVSPYYKMQVWDRRSSGRLDFDCCDVAAPSLGHIIEERVIKNALINVLSKQTNVTLCHHMALDDIELNDAYVRAKSGDFAIDGRLLIGADGQNSKVRSLSGFHCDKSAYNHHAIVCAVQTEKAHNQTAYQIFNPEGPLAFLPLADLHSLSIVWSVPPEKATSLMHLNDAAFATELKNAFQCRLGNVLIKSKRVSFPLFERKVSPYIRSRVALIGDALHTIHPLAGLGVNMGLADVASLMTALNDMPSEASPYLYLRRFERQQKGQHFLIMNLMKGLKSAFCHNSLPPIVRGLGMNLISSNAFIRKRLIKKAFGY